MCFVYAWYIFYDFKDFHFLSIFTTCCICFFVASAVLTLNTGFLQHGEIIYDRQQIWHKYYKEELFSNLIVIASLVQSQLTFDKGVVAKAFSFLVMLKIQSGVIIVRKIEEKLNLAGDHMHYWIILLLLLKVKNIIFILINFYKIKKGIHNQQCSGNTSILCCALRNKCIAI